MVHSGSFVNNVDSRRFLQHTIASWLGDEVRPRWKTLFCGSQHQDHDSGRSSRFHGSQYVITSWLGDEVRPTWKTLLCWPQHQNHNMGGTLRFHGNL